MTQPSPNRLTIQHCWITHHRLLVGLQSNTASSTVHLRYTHAARVTTSTNRAGLPHQRSTPGQPTHVPMISDNKAKEFLQILLPHPTGTLHNFSFFSFNYTLSHSNLLFSLFLQHVSAALVTLGSHVHTTIVVLRFTYWVKPDDDFLKVETCSLV
jgi:hypothetical protein